MSHTPFQRFGVMLDMSRNSVMRPDELKKFVTALANMGYNTLFLYTEDTYEIPEEKYFGHFRGRYSQKEIREIVAFCEGLGVEVIPCIQTLAHLQNIFKWRRFAPLRDTGDILLADEEKTYDLIRKMLKSVKAVYQTNVVHVGMDEAHMLGRGRHLDKYGYEDAFAIFCRHLQKVCDLAKEEGLSPVIWSDMYFRLSQGGVYSCEKPHLQMDKISDLPENVSLTYWDYYTTRKTRYRAMFREHKKLKRDVWFAGGIWNWIGWAPDNRFSIRAGKVALEMAAEAGVENVMITLWGDNGGECSRWATLPSLFALSRFARGEKDKKKIKKEFEAEFGISFDRFLAIDISRKKTSSIALKGGVSNEAKYLLFQDPLLGRFDSTLLGDESEFYKKCAARLSPLASHPQFGDLFRAQAALARTLSYKADLGVRARAAYQKKDKEAMKDVVRRFALAEKNLKVFARLAIQNWDKENKPFGGEVIQVRLGGAITRLHSCRERLEGWIEKDTPVEELDEAVLDVRGRGEPVPGHFRFNTWRNMFTDAR